MLSENRPAPGISTDTISGQPFDLSRLRGKKVLLKFHRFAGCPVARRQIDSYVAQHHELMAAGVESVIFLHSRQEHLAGLFPDVPGIHIVGDPDKVFYRRFHSAFRLRALWAPGTWAATFASLFSGYLPLFSRFEGGILAVPSDFLVDERGNITRVHYGRHFGDSWSAVEAIECSRTTPA